MLQKAKALVASAVIFMFLAGTVPGRALDRDHDRDDKCERRIHQAELKLERAIRKHGLHSIQAERRRDELEKVRARCHR